jgi:predicted ABC-type exoprotein transport system permease subunit
MSFKLIFILYSFSSFLCFFSYLSWIAFFNSTLKWKKKPPQSCLTSIGSELDSLFIKFLNNFFRTHFSNSTLIVLLVFVILTRKRACDSCCACGEWELNWNVQNFRFFFSYYSSFFNSLQSEYNWKKSSQLNS